MPTAGPGQNDLVILATNPDVAASLRSSFGVADPWNQARLAAPAGLQLRAASALAHPRMPERLDARLTSPQVGIVLGDGAAQCSRHFKENVSSGAEWRPLELALSHEAGIAEQTHDLVRSQSLVDGFFPTFAYMTLAKHHQWLPAWHGVFGSRLVVLDAYDGEQTVAALSEHFGRTSTTDGPSVTVSPVPSERAPQGATWDFIRRCLHAS